MATHHFEPTRFYTTLGPHEPALRIRPGDTVVTTTADCHGVNARGEQVGESPNPQTGPFYIEGAEPGDTLVVHIEHLAPNRDMGFANSVLCAHVVDAGYVQALPESERSEWRIDAERTKATLVRPETRLGNLTLPVAPMLGCFGVAPAGGQAISASTAGPHGGNMDYRGYTTGVTAYFPVFEPGALFSLGDGHAVQGDGEVVGTGIEISFDARFTVDLLKGTRSHWPRGENATHIFTVGNARPLDQALQHATTEMMRWLQSDFGFDPRGACILLGQCVEYEVGNVIDPAYTMVCKLRRGLLE